MVMRAPPAGGSADLKAKKQRHKPVRSGSVRKANVMKCRLLEEKKIVDQLMIVSSTVV